MTTFRERFMSKPIYRFAMVGTLTFILPIVIAAFLREVVMLGDQWSFFISAIIAIETNFILSYVFTWKLEWRWKDVATSFLKFHSAKVLTVGLGQALFWAINQILGFYPAYVAVVGIMTILNFLLQKNFIFRRLVSQAESR